METELAELEKKWESLVEKFDSLARVHLYRIVIAKAEKILAGLDHIFSIVVREKKRVNIDCLNFPLVYQN